MKEEIDAAADFLSRIFLGHEKIAKEKVQEFNANLADVLQERFRDHWHESFPTKGQAYRCIRICPEEPLDPLLEKVCNQVGVCVAEFNLPMELTLWVDPKEVVCKFGDLKCSYHVVAKKDQNSGTMNNQTEQMDIEDLVESARELYLKKQSMMTHPLNSSEIHIPGADGSSNRFSTALRINGTVHYNMYSTSPGSSYDGSPRGKGKSGNSPHHKRSNGGGGNGGSGGFHYYGKNYGVKGGFLSNGNSNGHSGMNSHQGGGGNGGFHRNHHHQQHHHSQGSSTYQNGYMNGYHEDNGYPSYTDQRSVSPSKMNGSGGGGGGTTNGIPPMGSMSQGSPTPEQIQQQMQHPPPMPPPPIPPHLHQPYSQPPPPPTDPTSLSLPPPPPGSQQNQQQSQSISSANFASGTTATSSISSSNNNSSGSSTNNGNNNNSHGGKMSNHNHNGHPSSKFQSNRGGSAGSRGNNNNRQTSPVKDVK